MKAVHFGAGNIGRGFIGEILHRNNIDITFVDVNDTIIAALKERGAYTIELADSTHEQLTVTHVTGLNNQTEPEKVVEAIQTADLLTTAIGPAILPHIAPLIAEGIEARMNAGSTQPLDIIACENMIGGSAFLAEEVKKHLTDTVYLDTYIGFPNAAVDRIVPQQAHEDPLFVTVEPFSEWVVDETGCRSDKIRLADVHYVADLAPYIERKLFSVNTGHATVAYTGALFGYRTIDEAMADTLVVAQLKSVLAETGRLLCAKWGFDKDVHATYIDTIIGRFQNKHISDDIQRVARTPIRKLGHDERFIKPIRELHAMQLPAPHLLAAAGMVFNYNDPEDEQSRQLHEMLRTRPVEQVITEVTGLTAPELVAELKDNITRYARLAV